MMPGLRILLTSMDAMKDSCGKTDNRKALVINREGRLAQFIVGCTEGPKCRRGCNAVKMLLLQGTLTAESVVEQVKNTLLEAEMNLDHLWLSVVFQPLSESKQVTIEPYLSVLPEVVYHHPTTDGLIRGSYPHLYMLYLIRRAQHSCYTQRN